MLATLWACALLGSATIARGEGAGAAADTLFREARAAARAGDYATACPKFRESLQLDPAPGTKLNVADCEEREGRLASALRRFREARAQLSATDDRVFYADERIAKLEKRTPHLFLKGRPGLPEARIFLDGAELSSAALGSPLPVDPGVHELRVVAAARVDRKITLSVVEGQTAELVVEPGDPRGSWTGSRESPSSWWTPRNTAGVIVGGVGLASFVVSGIATGLALSAKSTVRDHCSPDHVCDQEGLDANRVGPAYTALGTVTFAMGVLGVGVGGFLLFGRDPAVKRAALQPAIAPGGGSLLFSGGF